MHPAPRENGHPRPRHPPVNYFVGSGADVRSEQQTSHPSEGNEQATRRFIESLLGTLYAKDSHAQWIKISGAGQRRLPRNSNARNTMIRALPSECSDNGFPRLESTPLFVFPEWIAIVLANA
jgi:hypothetical protein